MSGEGLEIPISPGVRRRAIEIATPFNEMTGNRVARLHSSIPEKVLRAVDSLHKTAVRKLNDFLRIYSSNRNKEQTKGWSLLRTYKMSGTNFLYATDPIALDSVVVMRPFIRDTTNQEYECQPMFFWVSPEKDDKWHLPFIFQVVTEKSGKTSICLTSNVVCSNIAEAQVNADSFFSTSSPDLERQGMRFELDIWKQGQPTKFKGKEKTKIGLRKLVYSPQGV